MAKGVPLSLIRLSGPQCESSLTRAGRGGALILRRVILPRGRAALPLFEYPGRQQPHPRAGEVPFAYC